MRVEIRSIGPASCGTLVWRYRGELRVTAIVKASFSLVPGGVMTVAAPAPLYAADVRWGERQSLWAASDRVPFRLLADVVLVGHAWPPPGGGVARLRVTSDAVRVDRTLGVTDERDVGAGGPVPLAYELAFGGPRSADNPVGTGAAPGSALPTLIDVVSPRAPGGFGPVARTWPARARRLGAFDPAVMERPIADLPADFDWGYFQAAPPGQITDFLRGDEEVELEGMSREHPVLRTRLPGAAAAGRVHGLPGAAGRGLPIGFRADDLHIDADRMRCSLTFRASFSVPGDAVLPELVILAGVEIGGQRIPWPERAPERDAPAPGAPVPDIVEEDSELGVATLPFTTEEPAPAPGRQSTVLLEWPAQAAEAPAPAGRQSTVLLEWPAAPADAPAPAPVTMGETPQSRWGLRPQTPAPAQPAAGRQSTVLLEWSQAPADVDDDSPLMGTIPFSADHLPAPMASPFRLAEPGAIRAAEAVEIPGAPWSALPSTSVARPVGHEPTRSLALDPHLSIPDDLLREAPAPVAPPLQAAAPAPLAPAMQAAPPAPSVPATRVAREIARPAVKARIRARFPVPPG